VVPNSNPPKFVDVPAPLMVKTGIKDGLGKRGRRSTLTSSSFKASRALASFLRGCGPTPAGVGG
jgi:hypothetical protein